MENKIKKKDETLKEEYLKKFAFVWKGSDIYIPNNTYMNFDSYIIMKIDCFYHLSDKISHKKKKFTQSFELYADDYHKYFAIERFNINDESKLVELCMYMEKSFLKDYYTDYTPSKQIDIILLNQAKEIIFFYKKIIELMEFKNDGSIIIYKNKMKDFIEFTGYNE